MEFWIPRKVSWAVFRIPKPGVPVSCTQIFRIPDFTSKKLPDSRIRILLMGEPEQRPYQNIGLKLISAGGLNEHRRKLDCFTGLNKIAKLDPYTGVPYFTHRRAPNSG